MPFTLSHAAAVLPFSRFLRARPLLSATVIGSMVPDFGIFMPWHPPRAETHGLLPIVTFIIPVGLVSLWVFQYGVKQPAIAVLPDRLYRIACRYLQPASIWDLGCWLVAVAGIVFGALTHLAWDAFTHEGARGMRMIPALDELVLVAGGHHVGGQRLLQDVSSLIGFAIIAWWLLRVARAAPDRDTVPRQLGRAERSLWLAAYGAVAALVTIVTVVLMREAETVRYGLGTATNDAAVAGLRGLGASLLLVSGALRLRLRAG
jgi:hypothetical protein